MGKTVTVPIKESLNELKTLQRKQKTLQSEKRIYFLILLKTKKFKTQQETADYLGIERRTLSSWIRFYREGGIESVILKGTRNKRSKIITPEIHEGLASRVLSSENPFLGYLDAQQWVLETYNVAVKYHWLRQYLIKHFKTKLKSPRKSHYKKDKQAIEAFLKTP